MRITYQSLRYISVVNYSIVLTKSQLHILKIKYPLKSGWVEQLIGTEISSVQYNQLTAYKRSYENNHTKLKIIEDDITTSILSDI